MSGNVLEIKELVASLVHDRFGDVNITSIRIEPDSDSDGDDILRVTVVLSEKSPRLNSRRSAGFLRHLMPRLAEKGVTAFPIMSFTADDEGAGAAA